MTIQEARDILWKMDPSRTWFVTVRAARYDHQPNQPRTDFTISVLPWQGKDCDQWSGGDLGSLLVKVRGILEADLAARGPHAEPEPLAETEPIIEATPEPAPAQDTPA
jgi:hypothetical protein